MSEQSKEEVQRWKEIQEWASRNLPLQWMIQGVESQVSAVLTKHGYCRTEDVDDDAPESVRLAIEAAGLIELLRQTIPGQTTPFKGQTIPLNMVRALLIAFRCGLCAGALPGSEKMREKYSRTNTEIVEKIRQMRKAEMSDGEIALQLNSMGLTTNRGTEFKRGNISSYRRTHNIE